MLGKLPAENPHRPDELAQLPHGRHGLPPEFVEHNQRERLIASFTHLVGEVGYGGATITAIAEGASVSSRAFYKYFETVEDCCIAAFQKGIAELQPLLAEAYGAESEWPLRTRAATAAVLAEFADYPALGRVLTIEPFAAGPRLARLHKEVIEGMAPFLAEGRELRGGAGEPLPDSTERGLLGAAASLVARKLAAGAGEGLPDLLPDLTQFLLTPYLGASEARAIAAA